MISLSQFISPVKKARLTGTFGYRTVGGKREWHQGVDIGSTGKVPIYSAADGTVVRVGVIDTYGNVVILRHTINNKRMDTLYAHLDSYSVKVGENVKQGQQIAIMGNTGNAIGIHLHFEIHDGPWATGQPNAVDPMQYIKLGEDELTVSAEKQLQSQINQLNEELKALRALLNNKVDIATNEPVSGWAKEAWDWAVKEGLLDGTHPRSPLTREQQAIILMRILNKKEVQ